MTPSTFSAEQCPTCSWQLRAASCGVCPICDPPKDARPTRLPDRVRALVARWRAELVAMGPAPRLRAGRSVPDYQHRARPWHERQAAIAGALQFARELEQPAAAVLADGSTDREQRVAELRRAGLTFQAIAAELDIPIGSAKTIVRRLRLQAAKGAA